MNEYKLYLIVEFPEINIIARDDDEALDIVGEYLEDTDLNINSLDLYGSTDRYIQVEAVSSKEFK